MAWTYTRGRSTEAYRCYPTSDLLKSGIRHKIRHPTQLAQASGNVEKMAANTDSSGSPSPGNSPAGKVYYILYYIYNLFNNYSPKARWILSNNPRDEVEKIIRHYNPPINFRAILLATLRQVLDSYHAITPVGFDICPPPLISPEKSKVCRKKASARVSTFIFII